MYRLVYLALLLSLIFSCTAGFCQTPTVRPTRTELTKLDVGSTAKLEAQKLQNLRAPISRQSVMSALMADPRTKEVLIREGKTMGLNEKQLQTITATPVPPPTVVESNQNVIDWHKGVSFRMDQIPKGPNNTPLGLMWMGPCKIYADHLEMPILPTSARLGMYLAVLNVELPLEPGLYMLTIKIAATNGNCNPGWLVPKPNYTSAALRCSHYEKRTSGGNPTSVPVVLTTLPDRTGYAGVISANPAGDFTIYPMTGPVKCTAQINLMINPALASQDQPMGDLIFGGFTITRV